MVLIPLSDPHPNARPGHHATVTVHQGARGTAYGWKCTCSAESVTPIGGDARHAITLARLDGDTHERGGIAPTGEHYPPTPAHMALYRPCYLFACNQRATARGYHPYGGMRLTCPEHAWPNVRLTR